MLPFEAFAWVQNTVGNVQNLFCCEERRGDCSRVCLNSASMLNLRTNLHPAKNSLAWSDAPLMSKFDWANHFWIECNDAVWMEINCDCVMGDQSLTLPRRGPGSDL